MLRLDQPPAEAGQSCFAKTVDNAIYQRIFRPYDGQADTPFPGKLQEAIQVARRDRDIFNTWFRRGAGIAGRHVDFFNGARPGRLPGKRMFSASATYDQDSHINA